MFGVHCGFDGTAGATLRVGDQLVVRRSKNTWHLSLSTACAGIAAVVAVAVAVVLRAALAVALEDIRRGDDD